MTIKASGRSALILATGLLVCFAGPSHAAADPDSAATSAKPTSSRAPGAVSKYARRGLHRWKRSAHQISHGVAVQSSTQETAEAADDGDHSTAIPPSVADAHAQLASADTPTGRAAREMTARANDILQTAPDRPADAQPARDLQVVAADQLNDVDRALPAPVPPPMASAEAPAAPVMASNNEPSSWDQTSLIGKIFIGFGALLTMASAARMFMA